MTILYFHWHVVVKNGNFTLLITCSGQEWHFCHEIDRKTFIFWVNLGMWHLKSIISEKWSLLWGFQQTFMGFLRRYMENVHFWSKPRHVTPQINRIGKTSTILRVSTDIYGDSKEIDGKTFIFRVNLGMWPLKSIVLEKQALFWGSEHTFMGFLRR